MHAILLVGLCIAGLPLLLPLTPALVECFPIVGAVIALAAIVFGFITVRCPHCGMLLSLRGWDLTYCPYCGDEI